jgi:hypothetical protein
MTDPVVSLLKYDHAGNLQDGERVPLADALTHASTWLSDTVGLEGGAMVLVTVDLDECPARVDRVHQPVITAFSGMELSLECTECGFLGARTVDQSTGSITWSEPAP